MKPEEQKLFNQLLSDNRLTDPRWVAYIMATTKHETNHTFEPIEEAYWLSAGWRKGNLRYWPWHGRGFVQITWEANYQKLSVRLGIPALASDPEKALDWNVAYEILVIGMLEGLFTGKDLDDYINDDYADYYRARRIVNGMDKAALIEGYARDYENQIRALGTRFTGEPPDTQEPKAPKPAGTICTEATWHPGDNDNCVQVIQRALNKWSRGTPCIELLIDGDFGQSTRTRTKWFQNHNGLHSDGIVGPKTWLALERYL